METVKNEEIIKLIENLPEDLKREVKDFAEYLLTKSKTKKRLSLKWKGNLSKYKKDFTSLELQKKALEWRINFR
ncbi:DUF2281 domain-containing protein [Venenivibrio stagnispumantis]|uniref:DUF2281 domain-containing protein n=1 Tax=Venenivibrio stagnispumantis TaxID=407998 RepID=A0AA46ADR9_9AQUI|nr:DUF2281 domain-containing protein [Venenivibrio stagnispumantis]MCW4573061.1 DUF2281 domain-containing protein [Venenivibrio stagnispumantis]SMP07178.1 Protein of unknown function [Venenivibrio stagnispumantis]